MSNFLYPFLTASILNLAVSFSAAGQIWDTNLPDLVVKNLKCDDYPPKDVSADLVNRTATPFKGNIRMIIVDKDNDVIFQGAVPIQVDPINATKFKIRFGTGSCLSPNRITFQLQ